MKKTLLNFRLYNIVSCVLIIAAIIVMFLPCWLHEGNAISISDMTWFTTEKVQKAFTTYLTKTYKAYGQAFNINEVVTAPVALFLMGIGAILLAIFSHRTPLACLLALGAGVVALINFAGSLMYQIGSFYIVLLVLSALIAVSGLAGLVVFYISKKKKK